MTPVPTDGRALAFIRGVEAPLPAGERVLWQGAPERHALTRHAFHARKVLVYFAVLLGVAAVSAARSATPWRDVGAASLWLGASALAATGFAAIVAAMTTRATTYAITSRRVVLRIGMALPIVLNIPLRLIESVDLRLRAGGTGDLALRLGDDVRVAYLVLWPHARAWRLRHPEPLLRGLADPHAVGAILSDALRAAAESEPSAVVVESPRTLKLVTSSGHAA